MRTLLLTAAILGLAIQAQASERAAYDTSALPRDEASLSALDNKQLRLVRRAANQCDTTDPIFVARLNPSLRPCVTSRVDNAVATSDDPALQAYHAALPRYARYNQYRDSSYWQQLVIRQRAP